MTATENQIILYTGQFLDFTNLMSRTSPNGYKVSILLEELGLKYDVKHLSMQKNEQKVLPHAP